MNATWLHERAARLGRLLLFSVAAVIAGGVATVLVGPRLVQPVASQPTVATPAALPPGVFKPTENQWKALKIAPVGDVAFHSESITEGNIAIDDDLTTPVFSPYTGHVLRLIAKLGDTVRPGSPLFTMEASEFVQAQNDLITALAAMRTATAQVAQAKINERRAHDLYTAQGGALKDWQQSQTDLAAAQNT